MAAELHFERDKTALLVMDYQRDIIGAYPEPRQKEILARAAPVIKAIRRSGVRIIYVVVRFREGYPEISNIDLMRKSIKENGRLKEGSPGAEIFPEVAPSSGDIVVTKRRTGAFATTDLDAILRAQGIRTLALMGISSSGVVLSTLRWASDIDYQIVVLSDCCADRDEEVQRVLMEKVFPRQAIVITSAEFLKAIGL